MSSLRRASDNLLEAAETFEASGTDEDARHAATIRRIMDELATIEAASLFP